MDMHLACFKPVDTLLIAIETRRRHIYTLWRLRVCALLIVIKTCQGMSIRYGVYF